jgi:hypothetical protein
MPSGFGVAEGGATGGTQPTPTVHGPSTPMVPATIRIVEDLAAAAGHRLPPVSAAAPASSGSALGSVDLGSWLALAAGVALIAAAWTASLRARPGRRGLRRVP